MVVRCATTKRSNDRVLKACHRVFIKLHEIDYLGFIRLEIQGGPEDKKLNSGQNRKTFDKNVFEASINSIWEQGNHFGKLASTVSELTIETAKG